MMKSLTIGRTTKMTLRKQVLIDTNSRDNAYLYDDDLIALIREQINRAESDNLGLIGYPDTNCVSLSKSAFRYSNALVENGILYVDIETIHTPEGILFRRLLDSEVPMKFKALDAKVTKNILTSMGIEHTKPDSEAYKFISVCAIVSEQTQ